MNSIPGGPPSPEGLAETDRIGTTDLLKAAGLLLVVVDHVGLFFDVEQDWWRVVGRLAAPIFFFLIGYARSRQVPWTWLVLGLALTAMDRATTRSTTDMQLNLLLSFTLLRVALPQYGPALGTSVPRTALALGICVALIPVLGTFLEYGAEGWLWTLLGLARRNADEAVPPDRSGRAASLLAAAVAGVAYWFTERSDLAFDRAQSAVLAILVTGLALVLLLFRRRLLDTAPPAPVAALLRVCGRHSLVVYGVSLLIMQPLGYAVHGPRGEDTDDDDET